MTRKTLNPLSKDELMDLLIEAISEMAEMRKKIEKLEAQLERSSKNVFRTSLSDLSDDSDAGLR